MRYKYKNPLRWKRKIKILIEKKQEIMDGWHRLDERIEILQNQKMKKLERVEKYNDEINRYLKLLEEFPYKDQISDE